MQVEEGQNQEFISALIDPELLYEHAPCGYLSFLPDGSIVKVNQTFLSWLDLSSDQVLFNKRFIDYLSQSTGLYFQMYVFPLIKSKGEIKGIDLDIYSHKDEKIAVLFSAKAILNELGEMLAVNATMLNVSERRQQEEELQTVRQNAEAEYKRFEFLADITPDIIWTALPNGKINYLNKRFYDYLSLPKSDIDSLSLLNVIYAEDRRRCLFLWFKALIEERKFETELRMENAFGNLEWYLVRAVPHRDEQGNIVKWFGSCTNINEQKEIQNKKDEFISIASHELKTPLTALKGYIQFLNKMDTSDKCSVLIKKSIHAVNNLQSLIGSLLDVSKIQANQFSLNFSQIPILDVVNDSIENINQQYQSHRLKLINKMQTTAHVMADRQRIQQVVTNLLANAVKYSPQADEVHICLEPHADNKKLRVQVIDFGIGIPPEKLRMIFDRYYRVDSTKNNNKVPGLGIGLFIIKSILEMHGSEIEVKSEIAKGSEFAFSLSLC